MRRFGNYGLFLLMFDLEGLVVFPRSSFEGLWLLNDLWFTVLGFPSFSSKVCVEIEGLWLCLFPNSPLSKQWLAE